MEKTGPGCCEVSAERPSAKKHLEHVYGRLGVRNRTQAVARARELDLV